jgi:hypothetical protein
MHRRANGCILKNILLRSGIFLDGLFLNDS